MEEGNYDALVDTRLQHNYSINEMKQMISCAASCVRHSSRHRPRMSHVYPLTYSLEVKNQILNFKFLSLFNSK